jgi:predicted O-methyltransferase YrrM
MKLVGEHVLSISEIRVPLILEIGSHEGRSTVWMLRSFRNAVVYSVDPFPTSDTTSPVTQTTADIFEYNVRASGCKDRLVHYRHFSADALPHLAYEEQIQFDIIYIDGSHVESDVKVDLDYAHILIRPNGLIVLDDVGFSARDLRNPHKDSNGVAKALANFLTNYGDHYDVVLHEYQVAIRKKQ